MTTLLHEDPVDTALLADSFDRPGARRPTTRLWHAATWGEVLHGLLNLALTLPAFVLVVTLLTVGAGLSVVWVGLPVMVLGLLVARVAGRVQRAAAYALLGSYVRPPVHRRPSGRGPVRAATAVLLDPAAWRAVTFHLVAFVVSVVQFVVTVTMLAYGLGAVSYAVWQPYLPVVEAAGGGTRGWEYLPDRFADTAPEMLVLAAVGALVLLLMPFVVRFVTDIHLRLVRLLLGPATF